MSAFRLASFDALRIFALGLVTWQHVATTLGAYAEMQWRGVSPGQSGVAIFCVIAGYLACRNQPDSLADWCRRRFFVVFPAYWLVTLAAFAMALLVPNQKLSLSLFVSQMLGLGYFTHGWDLINVVSWFVSLILLCYALTVMAWKTGVARAFWWMIVVAATLLLLSRIEVPLSRHLLAYALGALIGLAAPMHGYKIWRWLSSLLVLTLCGIFLDPQFFYSGMAGLLLLIGMQSRIPGAESFAIPSRYAYEFFLVHGICLSVAMYLFGNQWFSIPTALVAAAASAVLVARLQHGLADHLRRLPGLQSPEVVAR